MLIIKVTGIQSLENLWLRYFSSSREEVLTSSHYWALDLPCTILAIIHWPMRWLEFSFWPIRADHQSWVRGNKNRVRVKASQVRPVTDGQTHQQITRPARVYIMVLLLCNVHGNRPTYRRGFRQIQIEEFALSKMYNYSHNAMSLLSQAAGWKPPNWLSMLWNSEYLVKMLLLRVWGIFRWLLKCAADNGGAADCQDQSFLSVSSGGEKNERFY